MDLCDPLRIDHVLYQRDANEWLFMDVSDHMGDHSVYQNQGMGNAIDHHAVYDDYWDYHHSCRNTWAAVFAKRFGKLFRCV